MKRIILFCFSIGLALVLIAACTQVTPSPIEPSASEEETMEQPVDQPPADNGEALIISNCSGCHSTDRIFRANKTEAEWETTINRMIGLGAVVTEEEQTEIIDWLVSREN